MERCKVEQHERRLNCLSNSKDCANTYAWFKQQSEADIKVKYSQSLVEALDALEMQPDPEIYFDVVPWEVLAAIEQDYWLMSVPDRFLRSIGSLLYTEIATPTISSSYQVATERLNLPTSAKRYWHLQAQPRVQLVHQILEDIARLVETQPSDDVWKILWGIRPTKIDDDSCPCCYSASHTSRRKSRTT
ncbi:MAG: iron-containing redox enzyme family protein [Hydrococcus sp. RM1_1_31]|nr:iron-containing redox enzyme family protein [Hydrococcus sp. RM1_1_31]